MLEVENMEDTLHALNARELVHMLLVHPPRLIQLMLYSLETPQEIEYLLVTLHNFLSKYGRKWSDISHTVV